MMETGMRVGNVSYFGQKRDLVEIKQERPEYAEIASHVLQDVLTRLEKAFQGFFRRVKNGETSGYLRFQGRNRYNSFSYPDKAEWKLEIVRVAEGNHKGKAVLHLSKIGAIRLVLHRPIEGQIKTATISAKTSCTKRVASWSTALNCSSLKTSSLQT